MKVTKSGKAFFKYFEGYPIPIATLRGRSFIMSYRLGVGGGKPNMTHYDREGSGGKTNYDV